MRTMNHVTYVVIALLMMLSCTPVEIGASEKKPKNVILILEDDVGYEDFRSNGAGTMPNIDQLAATGTIFERSYVAAPLCSPSRFGLYSGIMPTRYGWFYNPTCKEAMPLEVKTVAEQLKIKNVNTEFVGKWHLGEDKGHTPLQQGFDYFFGFLVGSHDYWIANEPNDTNKGMIWENNRQVLIKNHLTEELFAKGASRIAAWKKSEKHFMVISSNAAHGPLQPTPESLSLVDKKIAEPRRHYLGHIIDIDKGIGRLLHAIRSIGEERSTMFIITNDNGGEIRDKAFNVKNDKHIAGRNVKGVVADNGILRGGKSSLYDGGLRVPMVISFPGFEHRKVETPVNHLDIYPTLMEIFDVSTTAMLDGKTFLPCLQEGKCQPTTPYLYLTPGNSSIENKAFVDGTAAIVNWPWKLIMIKSVNKNKIQLFRIDKDPGEKRNIASINPDIVAQLNTQLEKFIENSVSWKANATKKIHKHKSHRKQNKSIGRS